MAKININDLDKCKDMPDKVYMKASPKTPKFKKKDGKKKSKPRTIANRGMHLFI